MAVGMNIDIASIDMVSEVNMVSTEVYGWVFADPHVGIGRRQESASGGGVCPTLCMMWGQGISFGTHCVCGFGDGSFWSQRIFPTWFQYWRLGMK